MTGTVALDHLITDAGERTNSQGGSAVFFALAASRHAPVHLLSAVGRDGEESVRQTFAGYDVDLSGLEVVDTPTFRCTLRHDIAIDQSKVDIVEVGPYPSWEPQVTKKQSECPVLFVGSLTARRQLEVIKASHARLIGCDTMPQMIAEDRDGVMEVVSRSDALFINHHELAALTGHKDEDWVTGALSLIGMGRLKAVVYKRAVHGSAVVTKDGVIPRPAPRVEVVDPTGAGDSLAGGFLGACALHEREDEEFFVTAMEEGIRCAADAISAFGTEGLRTPAPAPN